MENVLDLNFAPKFSIDKIKNIFSDSISYDLPATREVKPKNKNFFFIVPIVDENGFTKSEQEELLKTWKEANQNQNMSRSFSSAEALIVDLRL